MPDEPSNCDPLASNLQSAIDRKLTANESVLICLAGAHGEALVATDRRVMIVREQMPILASETDVDCFDYPYDQINTVRVEGAVGGGHLKLVLITPPVDDKEVTLYFPPYDLSKFDAGAARIRLLTEQTRSVPVGAELPGVTKTTPAMCAECMATIEQPQWRYCPSCGAERGPICTTCSEPLPQRSAYCPSCGSPASPLSQRHCGTCTKPLSPRFVYCPFCGTATGPRCTHCGVRISEQWARCAFCGTDLAKASIPTVPQPWKGEERPAANGGQTAEDHNAEGLRLYNEEQYDSAVAEFRQAIQLEPSVGLYHCNLAIALAETGDDEDALAEYHEALRLSPNDPSTHLNLGYFYSEREQMEQAEESWRKAIEVAPNSPEAEEAKSNLTHAYEV